MSVLREEKYFGCRYDSVFGKLCLRSPESPLGGRNREESILALKKSVSVWQKPGSYINNWF